MPPTPPRTARALAAATLAALALGAAACADPQRPVAPRADAAAEGASALVCDPRALGAAADGQTNDGPAIQAAIDQCAAAGGGTVRITGGTFLSAPVFLKSNVTLDLAADATLLATLDTVAYTYRSTMPKVGRSIVGLVNAGAGVTNVAITGGGTIDGQGAWWWANRPSSSDRPRLIVFYQNQGVLMDGVTVQNSPSFHVVPTQSQDLVFRNLRILAPATSPNTDGIDPSNSRNVTIANTTIDVGDDNVAIKAANVDPAHPGEATADVTITDCTFLHGHGLSIGTGLAGGVRRVRAARVRFDGTDNALRIKADRTSGGEVAEVTYDSITVHNVDRPIDIIGYYPESGIPASGTDAARPVTVNTPNYHDITISNFTATDDRPGQKNAALIVGVPEAPLAAIRLQNVSISGTKLGARIRNAAVSLYRAQITPWGGAALVTEENATVYGRVTQPAATGAVVDAGYTGADGAPVGGVPTYHTLGAALAAAPSRGGDTTFTISIRDGRYYEKLTVSKPNIVLRGQSRDGTVITYDAASGSPKPGGGTWGTSGSATLRVTAAGFRADNLTIENGFDYPRNAAKPAGDPTKLSSPQAVALLLDTGNDRAVLTNVRLSGYQDTFYAKTGRTYVLGAEVSGNIDFIFGGGTVVIDNSTIISRDLGSTSNNGYVTAASTPGSQAYGLVFMNSRLVKSSPAMARNTVALGRPWHPSADPTVNSMAVYINCFMDDHISAVGWQPMSSTDASGTVFWFYPADSRFYESGSTGPGAIASATRRVLGAGDAAGYTLGTIFGGWQPPLPR